MKKIMLPLFLVLGLLTNNAYSATSVQEEAINHISEFDTKEFENFSAEAIKDMLTVSYEELEKTNNEEKKVELTRSIETLENALTIIEAKAQGKWNKIKTLVKEHKWWVIGTSTTAIIATLATVYFLKKGYFFKKSKDEEEKTPLENTSLSTKTINVLLNNFEYLDDVQKLSEEELLGIKGIGKKRIEEIKNAQKLDDLVKEEEVENTDPEEIENTDPEEVENTDPEKEITEIETDIDEIVEEIATPIVDTK